MIELAVVTSNSRKAAAVMDALRQRGIAARHVQAPLTEIQDDDVGAIARAKAEQASAIVGGPVVVEDGGLYIPALDGFPGPYTAYALRTIGVEGLLAVSRGLSDRRAVLASRVAYADGRGGITVFADDTNVLQIARAACADDAPRGLVVALAHPRAAGRERTLSRSFRCATPRIRRETRAMLGARPLR